MNYTYYPKGVCSEKIEIELKNDRIESVTFFGGCNGNLKGISALVKGQKVNDVIKHLRGIECGSRMTSCPDQLAKALSTALKQSVINK